MIEKYKMIKQREGKQKIGVPKEYYDTKLMEITRKTFNKFPWGHIQTITYGDKRIGKSIYYIKTMMEQQRILHPEWTIDQCFAEVMHRTYFTIDEFVKDMRQLVNNQAGKEPHEQKLNVDYIISCHVDDAGCGFNKYKWFTQRKYVTQLKEILDVIGTIVNSLYFSSPTLKGMLGFIKEYECYRIHIISHSRAGAQWERIAKIYRWIELPSGTMRISSRIDQDPFSCYLDDKYFNKYWVIRQAYLAKSFDELEKIEKKIGEGGRYDRDLHDTLKLISDRLSS